MLVFGMFTSNINITWRNMLAYFCLQSDVTSLAVGRNK